MYRSDWQLYASRTSEQVCTHIGLNRIQWILGYASYNTSHYVGTDCMVCGRKERLHYRYGYGWVQYILGEMYGCNMAEDTYEPYYQDIRTTRCKRSANWRCIPAKTITFLNKVSIGRCDITVSRSLVCCCLHELSWKPFFLVYTQTDHFTPSWTTTSHLGESLLYTFVTDHFTNW